MMMLRAALQTADARQGTRESSAIQHPVKIPRQCAILVGGLGTRLGSLTADTPKPLLDCGGRPFLAWVLRELVRFGVNEVVLLAGHRSERVESFCRELPAWLPKPLSVKISVEPSPAGTGGALWHARHLLRDTFLLINGDSWFDTNLARFFAASSAQDAVASVLLREMEDCARYGTAEIEGDRVVAFREKASDSGPGLISCGVYVFDQRLFPLLSPKCSLETDILPALVSQRQLTASVLEGFFIDIGIPSDYVRAGQDLPRRLMRPAVFFDRALVIRRDLTWMAEAKDAVRFANDAAVHAFVVQAGATREINSARDAEALPENFLEDLLAYGATIDDIRLRLSTPDQSQREPATSMILKVLKTWNVDPRRAIVIGDQHAVQAGQAAGVEGRLYSGEPVLEFAEPLISRLRDAP
jgi:D-glycero-D-manno-heptose 1,7-bisphosphate phosphatase